MRVTVSFEITDPNDAARILEMTTGLPANAVTTAPSSVDPTPAPPLPGEAVEAPSSDTVLSFGKFKGTAVRDVDDDKYLDWLRGNLDVNDPTYGAKNAALAAEISAELAYRKAG